jgi:hypothetical protein
MNVKGVAWATSRESCSSFDEEAGASLPVVELVFPATEKDFLILPFAIEAAVKATKNPIKKITVYVPDPQREICSLAIRSHRPLLDCSVSIDVASDESILDSESINVLRSRFGSRAGWYVQQMIKLSSVVNSGADGVLIVDSDTILLKPRLWMAEDGRQILLPTYELHRPYRKHLYSLYADFAALDKSFVSHHMLMQPRILRSIFKKIDVSAINSLVSRISLFGEVQNIDDFFSEYELYSHGLITLNPELVEYAKWANLSMHRPESGKEIEATIDLLTRNAEYFSVSMHDYI